MALPDSGYEQHLADLATAWIEDHPAEAVRVIDRKIGAVWVTVESDRLEALEEIRQRVADGWVAVQTTEKAPGIWIQEWSLTPGSSELTATEWLPLSPEVAAVLWPAPSAGDADG